MCMLITFILASSAGATNIFEKEVPALPLPNANIVQVSDSENLKKAIENALPDSTIMVADGTYEVKDTIYMRSGKNVVIRGASGDPTKVIIKGKGFEGKPGDDLLRLANVENVTIAFMTFTECRSYGVKVEAENFPKSVHIYNCYFKDIGVRAIKGSSSQDGKAVGGSIKYCRFENTKIPPADWLFDGNYITAIDMMSLEGWVISDNFFKDMKGRTGGARGAIFIWVRSKNVTVDRNVIINCDRGISFGNPSGSTAFQEGIPHISNSIIRNNLIMPGPDAGIELWWADNVKVYNNTIWRENIQGRGIRGGVEKWEIKDVDVVNNLIRGTVDLKGGVTLKNNLYGELTGYFVDAKSGDLHLTNHATDAINKGIPLDDVTDDFDGHSRGSKPDMGACEY